MKKNKRTINIMIITLVIVVTSIVSVSAERMIASSIVSYNNGTSGLNSTNVQGAVDELYSKYVQCAKNYGNFACYLRSLEESDTVIEDDMTIDHNMRYTGKYPDNYVIFEGEEWRIIGTFNNIDDGTGNKESRVKIIKSESIGNKQWHSSKVNTWETATLNTELQEMSYASNNMIETSLWYLGDPGYAYSYTANQAYEKERNQKTAPGNDPTWTGKVGLIYPSDYGFASSECKDGTYLLNNYTKTECKNSNWLFMNNNEWSITPCYNHVGSVRFISSNGNITNGYQADIDFADTEMAVRPVVYLKSNVICKNCFEPTAGTKSNPFQIELS